MPNVRQRRNSVVIFKAEFHISDQRRNKDQLQKVEKNKKISLSIKKKETKLENFKLNTMNFKFRLLF